MNSQIDLQYLVGYCKQLPTFRDALPIMMFIKDWGIENRALEDAMLAEREVRNHFRLMTPQSENEEHKKLPLITETPEMPEFKFFSYVSDEKAVEFKEVLRECIAKIDTEGKKEWFCIYAAWRYYRGERDAKAAYVNFFTDIDALFPGLLKDLKTDDETTATCYATSITTGLLTMESYHLCKFGLTEIGQANIKRTQRLQ